MQGAESPEEFGVLGVLRSDEGARRRRRRSPEPFPRRLLALRPGRSAPVTAPAHVSPAPCTQRRDSETHVGEDTDVPASRAPAHHPPWRVTPLRRTAPHPPWRITFRRRTAPSNAHGGSPSVAAPPPPTPMADPLPSAHPLSPQDGLCLFGRASQWPPMRWALARRHLPVTAGYGHANSSSSRRAARARLAPQTRPAGRSRHEERRGDPRAAETR